MRVLCLGYYGTTEERDGAELRGGRERGVKEGSLPRGGETWCVLEKKKM